MSRAKAFPAPSHPSPRLGEPTWDLALMYPLQGSWSVDDYLALDTGLMVEYTAGFVRVLPMPTVLHQLIVQVFFRMLDEFVTRNNLGAVLLAPLPVRLAQDKYREPDVVYVQQHRIKTVHGHPDGADLVAEVVSPGEESRQRDYVEKRRDYAQAGITEYWIIDPQEQQVTVLALSSGAYREHGVFRAHSQATSALLPGFVADVDQIFAKRGLQME